MKEVTYDSKDKKKWNKPDFIELDISETQGGPNAQEYEDEFETLGSIELN